MGVKKDRGVKVTETVKKARKLGLEKLDCFFFVFERFEMIAATRRTWSATVMLTSIIQPF